MGPRHLTLTLVIFVDFTFVLAHQGPKAATALHTGRVFKQDKPGTNGSHALHTYEQDAEVVQSQIRQVEITPFGAASNHDTTHANLVPQETSDKPVLAQVELNVVSSKNNGTHVQQPITTTESESWFSRLGNSLANVIIGIILIVFSIPIMWQNERRKARMESLIADGEKECVEVKDAEADANNRGNLVLAAGDAKAAKRVESKQFKDVKFDDNCIRLMTTVEVYQWIEHAETKESKNNIGGGKTKKTTYSYTKAWSSQKIDSSNYQDNSKVNNFPMTPTLATENCDRVEFGKNGGFVVPDGLLSQLGNFESANNRLGSSVTAQEGRLTLQKTGLYFTHGPDNEIGSVRAKFQIVPDGPFTVLALQADGGTAETFLPYRPVARGSICGRVSDEVRKQRLLDEGSKTPDQLSSEDQVSCGPFNTCFCCCIALSNLASLFFNSVLTTELYKMSAKNKKKAIMFMAVKQESSMVVTVCRILGWVMMLVGSYMLFDPILTLVDIIPFLGPLISTFGGWLIWIVCLLVTLILSCLIMTTAYMVYRPMLGVVFVLITAALVAVPITIVALVND